METHYPDDADLIASFSEEKANDFVIWIDEIEQLIRDQEDPAYDLPLAEGTGLSCWFDYYNDGYSPRDALAEDADNGDYD